MVLWDQRLPCPKYGFLLQSAMIDLVAYIIHSTLKKELRTSRYVAKDQPIILTKYYVTRKTRGNVTSFSFLPSCGNETGSHHNCCILGMLYCIVDISSGWMEQLRIRGKIIKFLAIIWQHLLTFP